MGSPQLNCAILIKRICLPSPVIITPPEKKLAFVRRGDIPKPTDLFAD
jgi:hypothetical protein